MAKSRRFIYLFIIIMGMGVSMIGLTGEHSASRLFAREGMSETFLPFVTRPLEMINTTADGADWNPGDGRCETAMGNNVCTLRAMIQEANAKPGPDTIFVPAGQYVLTIAGTDEDNAATGDLDILETLTVIGENRDTAVIDGNQIDRVFHMTAATTSMSNLTITNGDASGGEGGGGIFNDRDSEFNVGTLTINNVVVDSNIVTGFGGNNVDGGGIYSVGPLTVVNSIISNNETVNGSGGGISSDEVVIQQSVIQGNFSKRSGGGISAREIEITDSVVNNNTIRNGGPFRNGAGISIGFSGEINRTTISNNQLTNGEGGGIHIGHANVTILQSAIFSNTLSGTSTSNRGAGIFNESTQVVTIIDTIIKGNVTSSDGGGIYFDPGFSSGQMVLDRVTVRDNVAEFFGGGISNSGDMFLTNVTLSGNQAVGIGNQYGGGIYQDMGLLRVNNSTFSENVAKYGGAIYRDMGTVILENTILANNIATGVILPGEPDTHNCSGPIGSAGYNLEDGVDCNLNAAGDISAVDPLLLPLLTTPPWADVYPLSSGSPAIDKGNNSTCAAVDQRGVARPVDGDSNGSAVCDIGAYEYP